MKVLNHIYNLKMPSPVTNDDISTVRSRLFKIK